MNKKVILTLVFALSAFAQINAQSYIRFKIDTASITESTDSVSVIVEQYNADTSNFIALVAYDRAASTAVLDTDFTFSNRGFQIAPGETKSDTLKFRLKQDGRFEGTEYAVIKLKSVLRQQDVAEDSVFTLAIFDDDSFFVSFIGAGKSYIENDTVAVVRVTTNGIAPDSAVVRITLDLGNATRNVDYSFTDTTLIFAQGTDDTLGFRVTLYQDTIDEVNEQLNLNLTKVSGSAKTLYTTFTLTIVDDDAVINSIFDNKLSASAVSVYPNPFSGRLNISTELEINEVVLYNAQGQECLRQNSGIVIEAEKLQNLPAGNYILQLVSGDNSVRKNLIKVN